MYDLGEFKQHQHPHVDMHLKPAKWNTAVEEVFRPFTQEKKTKVDYKWKTCIQNLTQVKVLVMQPDDSVLYYYILDYYNQCITVKGAF